MKARNTREKVGTCLLVFQAHIYSWNWLNQWWILCHISPTSVLASFLKSPKWVMLPGKNENHCTDTHCADITNSDAHQCSSTAVSFQTWNLWFLIKSISFPGIFSIKKGDTFQTSAWIQWKSWLLLHEWECVSENSLAILEVSAKGVLTLSVPMLLWH